MNSKIFLAFVVMLLAASTANALIVSLNDYDPKPAEAGKYVDIWVRVENPSGDPVDESFLELRPRDGLQLASGEQARKRVGFISEQSSQIVEYRLFVKSDAIEGANRLDAVSILQGVETESTLSLLVTEKDILDVDLGIGDIESDPSRIKPDDDDVKLEVTILNLGDARAQAVTAELTSFPKGIELSESYSGTSLLGNIPADSQAVATFYIDMDKTVAPKEHSAQLKLSYKYKPDEEEDEYLFEEKSLPLKIAVRPIPLYNVTGIELDREELTAGDKKVKVTLTIQNIGEETGESVRIKVYGKTEQPFDYDKTSDFVAPMLEPGDSGQATIEFDVEEDANVQTYLLDLEIKNVVGNDVITYQEKLPLAVDNPLPDNPWSVAIYGVILIAVLVGVFVVRRYMGRGKKASPKKVKPVIGEDYLDRLDKHKKR